MKRWLPLLSLASGLVIGQDSPPAAAPVGDAASSLPAVVAPTSPAAVAGTEKAIPQAYSEEHYASTWSRNPFLIEVTKAPATAAVGFADDWELRGLVRNKGLPEALLGNKKTQEFHWVKTTEDKDGFKLLNANINRDLHESSVEVAKAGESSPATFKFPEVAAVPTGGNRPPPVPGQQLNRPGTVPGQPPGGAVRPGLPSPGGAVPRMNPGAQPSTPGRRRVLIPAQPAAGKPAS